MRSVYLIAMEKTYGCSKQEETLSVQDIRNVRYVISIWAKESITGLQKLN